MGRKRKLINRILPTEFDDFLSIISFLGFLGIFLTFIFNLDVLSNIMTPIFLIVGGLGLLFVGQIHIFKRKKERKIRNLTKVMYLIFGSSSIIMGTLLLFNIDITLQLKGIIGFIALIPAGFIIYEYFRGK
ncbi:hypothetical protein CL617_04925 [archaeon]|nr:hypothetical protein [archaeon]|tara:strand:- start:1352 stop:1744 length:393 start_codon:yes stop_codon:yes gene_type:complete